MPQINIYCYLSQTTWTIILFILYFFIIKSFIIPLIIQSIKIRSIFLSKKDNSIILKNQKYNYNHIFDFLKL